MMNFPIKMGSSNNLVVLGEGGFVVLCLLIVPLSQRNL